jgi:hypothetical protein
MEVRSGSANTKRTLSTSDCNTNYYQRGPLSKGPWSKGRITNFARVARRHSKARAGRGLSHMRLAKMRHWRYEADKKIREILNDDRKKS